ncbi:uncharacterized protein N7446_003361 [Penicillium canescens]|uniref:Uncharacterized protein n=1 Tax=Penicillium canescens TaxID=5083 RepID=A0AAD6NAN8_PENCN|nr:uncharacterized protein N7446_003361 [Penicillium canescens]KAJ6045159.1 hypothetical protein N7460_006514 [Penicillium canescens]KAJ6056629.1 hypothetical protein N7444_005727 [Penicillium canescens]KAJ6075584.1 hypothetical protein N7446_003361 [Penicillium canescens]
MAEPPNLLFPRHPDDLEHPPEPSELYDLMALKDPPEDWKFLTRTLSTSSQSKGREIGVGQIDVVMKHYFWGIHYEKQLVTAHYTRKRRNIIDLKKMLWKLFYYMQEQHRPKSWMELFNFNRDSGPRLMKYDLEPRPTPVSRWYRTLPEIDVAILPGYQRPSDAKPETSDGYLQQFLFSADTYVEPSQSIPRLITVRPGPVSDQEVGERIQEYLQPSSSPIFEHWGLQQSPGLDKRNLAPLVGPNKRRRVLSPGAPAYTGPKPIGPGGFDPIYAAPIRRYDDPIYADPSHSPLFTTAPVGYQQINKLVDTALSSAYDPRNVTEIIEKALMNIAYNDLERDPSAPIRTVPTPQLTARSLNDLFNTQLGTFNNIANVRLDPVTFKWDANGLVYPLRGRGPIWSGNSCSIDAVIAAGILIDAGCTRIDRYNNRQADFKDIEKAFVETINVAWDVLDEHNSRVQRDMFFQKVCDTYPSMKMGQPVPPWAVWAESTKNFAQFRFFYAERIVPCRCTRTKAFVMSHQGSCVMPAYIKGDEKGIGVSQLLERCFYARKESKCIACGGVNIRSERKVGQLPLRLTMTFDGRSKILDHTKDIDFQYIDYGDNVQRARYRWLGGVYIYKGHARVYWTDTKRGEYDTGNICMYDSQLNHGLFAGGIPCYNKNNRVPIEWCTGGAIPLVFYERIMNPAKDVLAAALQTVQDMTLLRSQDKEILQNHNPWAPSSPQIQKEPWNRVLPGLAQPFTAFPPFTGYDEQLLPGQALSPPIQTSVLSVSPPVGAPLTPSSANRAALNPALLDPNVIDWTLIDPALLASTAPPPTSSYPAFNWLSYREPVPDAALFSPPTTVTPSEDGFDMYHGALDFAQQDPNWFAEMSTLWPHGQPAEEGALDFPGLAENPQLRTRNDAVSRDADNDVMMMDVDVDESDGGTRAPHPRKGHQARRKQAPAVTPEVSDAEFEVQLTPRRQTRYAKRLGTESPKKASPKKAAKSPPKKAKKMAKKDSEEDSEPKRVQPPRRGKK